MIGTLTEILSPSFPLRDALIGSGLVGLVCPLVGVYFVPRRMVFLWVALPQVSAAGIAGSISFTCWLCCSWRPSSGGRSRASKLASG